MNIPEGYKLVPVEPTVAMEDAAAPECGGCCPRCDTDMQIKTGMQVDIYRAMLASAPTTPQPIYDEAKELAHCRETWEKTGVGVVFPDYWAGWQARAKSVEVGDE